MMTNNTEKWNSLASLDAEEWDTISEVFENVPFVTIYWKEFLLKIENQE